MGKTVETTRQEEEEGEWEEEERRRKTKKKKKREEVEVEVQALSETTDRIAPLVGYFPSGFDPQRGERDPRVRVFRNQRRPNRLELVVNPEDSGVEFVGSSYSGEAAAAQLCTYALGVLDKDARTLKIVPIAANKIFRLEPRVIGKTSPDAAEAPEESKDGGLTTEKMGQKMKLLTNLYGAKKEKKKVKKWDTLNKQRNDPEAREDLEDQMKGIEINKEALENGNRKVVLNIPPHDLTATTPEKAYILDEIIHKVEWDHLLDILDFMESGENVASTDRFWQENGYPSFVSNRIQKLRAVQDEEEKRKLACILSYITHLLKFMDIASHSRNFMSIARGTSANFHNIPRVVFQKFLKLFVDPETYALSNEKKDLLISYILVLTLFADRFQTDPTDVARDLKMAYLSLRPHYQQLGCRSAQHSKFQSILTLPVPLKIPELMKRRKRRR